jgi:DNA-binding NarL/FixJ family response regulator
MFGDLDEADVAVLVCSMRMPAPAFDTSTGLLLVANDLFSALLRLRAAALSPPGFESFLPSDHVPDADDLLAGIRGGAVELWQGRTSWRRGDGDALTARYRLAALGEPSGTAALLSLDINATWRPSLEVSAGRLGDRAHPGSTPPARLSPRQSEILRRLYAGEKVGTIANALSISESTVRNHLAAIFRRVGVHSQGELLALQWSHPKKAASWGRLPRA